MTPVQVIVMLAAFTVVSGSGGFLSSTAAGSNEHISKQEVQTSLLEEIEASLGTGTAAKRLHEIEEQLRPMFASLPKNEHGGLGHSVVRYALHRLFVQRHGWLVEGLDPAGSAFNDSSPAGILKTQVSSYLQELFEERMHGKGLGLHELAVFAATIEHLIHNEAVGRLGDALALHSVLPTSPLTAAEADQVLDSYMMAYIIGADLKNMSQARAKSLHAQMPKLYLSWRETQKFIRSMRQSVTAATATHEINFATLAKVAQTLGEKFGRFQDGECQDMKAKLVGIEDRGSGRARLADFYKPALMGGDWQFQESAAYLRQLGVLDEADPADPRVIIVNYVVSQTNCIASSSFYSVCCMNECEALLGHIEEQVASPETTAQHIVSLVQNLPSSSVSAPRKLSPIMLQRLNDIATGHGGTVPIHGRLFAQWMHHAFPRECPYPHLSNTTQAHNAEEWLEDESNLAATQEEMLNYHMAAQRADAEKASREQEEFEMPWLHEEELLVVRVPQPSQNPSTLSKWTGVRGLLLFVTLVPMALGLVGKVKVSQSCDSHNPQKFFV
mmetsp:Transcript_26986/g.49048  ORF Transcript_26986/g.49048 Transcript_26986/m.49048 type:complete len:556 (+) Transcript_26986:85-1752(+)